MDEEELKSQRTLVPSTRTSAIDLWDRWEWVTRVRPIILGGALLRLIGPVDRRQIFTCSAGLKIYTDPISALGSSIRLSGSYEPAITALVQRLLRPGMRFLDVGANEGYYSALAGVICGSQGHVVAVEPQDQLRDLIAINAALNGVTSITIFSKGFGGDEGVRGTLNLFPSLNSGASSVVRSYRLSRRTQTFEFISFKTLLASAGGRKFDLVKVDVEGFEPEAVRHLVPHLEAGLVGRLLLDYHDIILSRRGIHPGSLHDAILRAGARVELGDPSRLSSYLLYAFETADRPY